MYKKKEYLFTRFFCTFAPNIPCAYTDIFQKSCKPDLCQPGVHAVSPGL